MININILLHKFNQIYGSLMEHYYSRIMYF
jgi:hypothetical protein